MSDDKKTEVCRLCGAPKPETVHHLWACCGDGPSYGDFIKQEKLACVERQLAEAKSQLGNVLDSHAEGAWQARALDAERELRTMTAVLKPNTPADLVAAIRAMPSDQRTKLIIDVVEDNSALGQLRGQLADVITERDRARSELGEIVVAVTMRPGETWMGRPSASCDAVGSILDERDRLHSQLADATAKLEAAEGRVRHAVVDELESALAERSHYVYTFQRQARQELWSRVRNHAAGSDTQTVSVAWLDAFAPELISGESLPQRPQDGDDGSGEGPT